MGGDIADLPVHVCRSCMAVWVEDDQMYETPDRCPRCGAYPKNIADGDDDTPYV